MNLSGNTWQISTLQGNLNVITGWGRHGETWIKGSEKNTEPSLPYS